MKNFNKMFAIAFLAIGFATTASAQQSATANATSSATIVSPIAITHAVDMNFGNIAVGASGGTVALSPASTRLETGGITLPVNNGTVAAASFNVTGEGAYTYAITLPTSVTITKVGSTETMTVDAFTSTPSGTGTLSSGAQTLNVGATLHVGAAQASGVYNNNSTPFAVSVVYN